MSNKIKEYPDIMIMSRKNYKQLLMDSGGLTSEQADEVIAEIPEESEEEEE